MTTPSGLCTHAPPYLAPAILAIGQTVQGPTVAGCNLSQFRGQFPPSGQPHLPGRQGRQRRSSVPSLQRPAGGLKAKSRYASLPCLNKARVHVSAMSMERRRASERCVPSFPGLNFGRMKAPPLQRTSDAAPPHIGLGPAGHYDHSGSDFMPGFCFEDRFLYTGLIRLHLLHHAAEEPICGLKMIEKLRRYGYVLSAGTLYPLLNGQKQKGYLTSSSVRQGRSGRRMYRTTRRGRTASSICQRKSPRTLWRAL